MPTGYSDTPKFKSRKLTATWSLEKEDPIMAKWTGDLANSMMEEIDRSIIEKLTKQATTMQLRLFDGNFYE
jgi:hypothetical protein